MWGSLKHKFVLPFYGIYEFDNGRATQFFLISPFMMNGTLAQWRKKTNLSVAQIEERVWPSYLWLFIDTYFSQRYWKWPRASNIFIQ
jgi:hypothetical protein